MDSVEELWPLVLTVLLTVNCLYVKFSRCLQISADDVQRFVMTLHLKLSHRR